MAALIRSVNSSRREFLVLALAGSVLGIRATAADDPPGMPEGPMTRVPTPVERDAAQAAIEGQLKAFKADDFERAMGFQSGSLRRSAASTAQFRRSMRGGYPQVVNYRTVRWGEARWTADEKVLALQVELTGEDEVVVRAVYLMVVESGEYKVASVLGGTRARQIAVDTV